jgi:2,3-bisphosphoglycerate-independent phosphoglycerate mutase
MKLKTMPPHDISDQAVAPHLPKGEGADRVLALMDRAARLVEAHPQGKRRAAAGHLPATGIWLWGQGRPVPFESFRSRFGVTGEVITAVDIIRGMAKLMGFELLHVPGATGFIDTDYDTKGRAAVGALDRSDLVIVHVEAADEAGHLGDAKEKVKALERIDEAVVGPLLAKLKTFPEWRILLAPDHPTPASTKAHSSVPPIFAYAGTGVSGGSTRRFTEDDADTAGERYERGWELMPRFLGKA